jgi:hypothetical protein
MISIMMYEWSIFLTTPILTETNWRTGANTETQAAFRYGKFREGIGNLKNHTNVISESVNFFHINFQPSSSSDRLTDTDFQLSSVLVHPRLNGSILWQWHGWCIATRFLRSQLRGGSSACLGTGVAIHRWRKILYTWVFIGYTFLSRADYGLISVHIL